MTSISKKKQPETVDDLDFGRMVGELIDHRKIIIALTSFATLIALLYAFLRRLYIKLML